MERQVRAGRLGSASDIGAGGTMEITKQDLSDARRRLLELMQEINFGRIEGLVVKGGEPVFDPSPRVVREIKFGGENGPRRELGSDEYILKSQVVEFFAHLSRLDNGTVETIQVKHGLPFLMSVEETIRV